MNILFVSLGCDKNLVDSEVMLGIVKSKGYNITNEEDEADVIVVNTCCFIHDAKEESINTILELAQLKKTGQLKSLIVTGCLAERYKEEIKKEIEEVDVVLGSASYDAIGEAIADSLEGKLEDIYKPLDYLPKGAKERVITTGTFMAYLKIAEGCDKHCTYCIIPSIRGGYRSVPKEDILETAKALAAEGIKELIVVAQETTIYGQDLYGEKYLPKLLDELSTIEGIEWIRLMYCYPEEITDELIQVMASNPKILHYIDMPIQHSEDSILKNMARKTSKSQIVEVISKLRTAIPDICIRTTLITGFPGETEENHEELLSFVDEMEFDRLGAFNYSREEDTPAAAYDHQVDEKLALKRKEEIMELQQSISLDNNEKMIGKTLEVIIEGYLYEDNIYVGRTYKDAPNIDSFIFVNSNKELISGSIINVTVTDYNEYDLIGEI